MPRPAGSPGRLADEGRRVTARGRAPRRARPVRYLHRRDGRGRGRAELSIHDRDYYREPPSPRGGWSAGARLATLLPAAWLLPGTVIGAFLLQKILENGGGLDRGELVAALGLSREGLAAGRVWQPLTSLLLHANLAHALVNALGLWVFGSVVESRRGPGTTLLVFLVGGLAGGAAFLGWGALAGDAGGATVVIGASGGASALLAASVLAAPRETVVLFGIVPTPLWLVGALFLGTDVARILTGARDGVAVETHLGGAAAGACLHAWARRRGAARLRAPSVGRGDAARGAAARRPDFHRLGADDAEAARVDLLLERIHADGIAALTDEEREFLRRVSERLRGRPRG